jgi:hypothetical protein
MKLNGDYYCFRSTDVVADVKELMRLCSIFVIQIIAKFLNWPAITIFKTACVILAARNALYTQFKSMLGNWK